MDTLGATPPAGAVVLFDGTDLANWTHMDGADPGWRVEDGVMHVVPKTGDVLSKEQFLDHFLHLEFRCPDMPDATGQAKGNSGVYLQGRYEIQVLDSYGWETPGMGDCGGIYNQHAPLVNACKPGGEWQSYDIVFRAARVEGDQVVEPVRLTVIHNGLVVQNNAVLEGPTGGAIDETEGVPGPLRLQDHGDLVCYRNLWAVPLPEKGSDTYEPR
jgi:3-keto-disaccharide hydrolase